MSAPIQVNCPKCGNEIGEQVVINGVTLFHVGGVLNREQCGWCIQCGAPFYWYVKDTYMMEVISAMQTFRRANAK